MTTVDGILYSFQGSSRVDPPPSLRNLGQLAICGVSQWKPCLGLVSPWTQEENRTFEAAAPLGPQRPFLQGGDRDQGGNPGVSNPVLLYMEPSVSREL